MDECLHEWAAFNPGEKPGIDPIWAGFLHDVTGVKIESLKQCTLCYHLLFDLDYVPGTPFVFIAYSRGVVPTDDPEP